MIRDPKTPPPPPPSEPANDPERKERVIHTRVPEYLESELRERAQALGISVSNLVRNVLGHAFGLVGDVAADLDAIAHAARGDRGRAKSPAGTTTPASTAPASPSPPSSPATADPPAPIDDVLAWQAIVLGKNAVCARCNELLPRGRDAAIGIAEHGGARVIVCSACLEEIRQ